MTDESGVFQVDLGGIVDLLSQHLYASPDVYVRELLQNCADAITARRLLDPSAPGDVRVVPADVSPSGALEVHDTGIGLTLDEIHLFLATIGRSSKRDDLGFARGEFLGQFGIGLLSCFMVSDTIEVTTRSARGGSTVRWTGRADGSYVTHVLEDDRSEPGTTVRLLPRRGSEALLAHAAVTRLVGSYGGLLPIHLSVESRTGSSASVTSEPAWLEEHGARSSRQVALSSLCRASFGFAPFDVIDLDVPLAGVRGVAFVLPTPANPSVRASHRVYLKRMLLSAAMPGVLPDWAFFVRCVLDTTGLRPTASREAFYEDEVLLGVRDALGAQIRSWLLRLAVTDPGRMETFMRLHYLGVKALALHDDEMLAVVRQWMPYESTAGTITLDELHRRFGEIRYAATVDEFRQIASVAAAEGVGLVNGGYAYDTELLERMAAVDDDFHVGRVDPAALAARLELVTEDVEVVAAFQAAAEEATDALGCALLVRSFDPPTVPALYVVSADARHQRQVEAAEAVVDDLWGAVLGGLATTSAPARPQLVLNWRNPLVRRVAAVPGDLVGLAVTNLYGQALLAGHHPMRAADSAAINRSLLGLLDWAVGLGGPTA